jgi:glycine oxidase
VAGPRDIVVVGAGVVGCAVAYELARRGASVELVDDRPAGSGATQASAGMLAPFLEAREPGPLLDLTARGLQRYDEFVARVSADSAVAVKYQRSGTLEVALQESTVRGLSELATTLHRRGVSCEWHDAAAVRALEPAISSLALGGLLIPDHGAVLAHELTRALVVGARRHGAQVIERGRARRISTQAGEVRVETERGSLTADAVVIAAGSWSGQIEIDGARTRVPVTPIRGQLLHLTWADDPPSRVLWSEHCYVVPWADQTVLVGATVEDAGFDERTTVEGVRRLLDASCDLLPGSCRATFTAARVGLRPSTPDHLPVIGWSPSSPTVMYATGHYRNGVLLAPLTAELVADAMLDGRIDPLLESTSPARFGDL